MKIKISEVSEDKVDVESLVNIFSDTGHFDVESLVNIFSDTGHFDVLRVPYTQC